MHDQTLPPFRSLSKVTPRCTNDALPLDGMARASRNRSPRDRREASTLLAAMEAKPNGQSACSALGHKGDLMLVHFRDSFDQLNQASSTCASSTRRVLEPTFSYLSVVELGLYESTLKTYKALAEQGRATLRSMRSDRRDIARQKSHEVAAVPTIPPNRYICFYPMDRGAAKTRTGTRFHGKNASAR